MTTKMRWATALIVAVLLGAWQAAPAAEPTPTTITVPEMDCPSCAKKIADRLTKVSGVAKAEADATKKTITVTPKAAGPAPSPKDLWEAVKKSDKTPSKLHGPSGTFTAKPRV